jgi:hypothetical protein
VQRPDPPDLDTNTGTLFVPYIDIDVVHYNDKAPWPTNADGLGPSLERLYATAYGNDPINWRPSPNGPSPGLENNPLPPPMQISSVGLSNGSSPGLNLQFSPAPGQSYIVQYRDSLTTGAWLRLADVSAQSALRSVTIFDPGFVSSRQRFYRIASPWQP